MRHITGNGRVALPNIKRLEVSAITPRGDAAPAYQRTIKVVTDAGILELRLSAAMRETLSLAADPLPVRDELLGEEA